MGKGLSVTQMLAQLEAKIALHREQQAFHEKQEELHRQQKTQHAADLGKAIESYEAFRNATAGVGQVLEIGEPASPSPTGPAPDEVLDLPSTGSLSPLIARIVQDKRPGETFGPAAVTQELNERWGTRLHGRVERGTVSATLRRWANAGRLKRVRDGWAHAESLYTRR